VLLRVSNGVDATLGPSSFTTDLTSIRMSHEMVLLAYKKFRRFGGMDYLYYTCILTALVSLPLVLLHLITSVLLRVSNGVDATLGPSCATLIG
jgi:hypothetical protein